MGSSPTGVLPLAASCDLVDTAWKPVESQPCSFDFNDEGMHKYMMGHGKGLQGDVGGNHSHSKPSIFALIVDHRLRRESTAEAITTAKRVTELGLQAHVMRVEWSDGPPRVGNLMQEARRRRFTLLGQKCSELGVSVLMTAHHAGMMATMAGTVAGSLCQLAVPSTNTCRY